MDFSEQERFGITEVVDERTQWEMYYPPFQAAVDAGLWSIMCSYNKVQLAGEQNHGCEYIYTKHSASYL